MWSISTAGISRDAGSFVDGFPFPVQLSALQSSVFWFVPLKTESLFNSLSLLLLLLSHRWTQFYAELGLFSTQESSFFPTQNIFSLLIIVSHIFILDKILSYK